MQILDEMRVILHPGAEEDSFEAAAFYQGEGSPAVAGQLVTEFRRVALLISDHPEIASD